MSKSLDEIKRMICEEIDEIAKKGEMSAGDLDVINKLVITKEKLLRIEELEEDLGYSEDGEWSAIGSYGRNSSYDGYGSYDRSNSYYRGNPYARRDMRGRYSRAEESVKSKMMDMLKNGDFTSSQKQAIQRMIDEM